MKTKIFISILLILAPSIIKAQISGYVMEVENDNVYIDLTKKDIKPGDTLSVFKKGGYMLHPLTKEKILKEDEYVGKIITTKVLAQYSIATPLAFSKPKIESGMIVKIHTRNEIKFSYSPAIRKDDKCPIFITDARVNDALSGRFGTYVAEMLVGEMLNCPKVRIVDRSILGLQMDEIDLTGEYINPANAINHAKISGVRYLLKTTLAQPDIVNLSNSIPLHYIFRAGEILSDKNLYSEHISNVNYSNLESRVRISVSVIDFETGEVVFQTTRLGKAQGRTQFSAELGAFHGGQINGGIHNFKQTITSKAIERAFRHIGEDLRLFFENKTNIKKVSPYDGVLTSKGYKIYFGGEKLEKEDIKDAFYERSHLYNEYKKAKRYRTYGWIAAGVVAGITTTAYVMDGSDSGESGAGYEAVQVVAADCGAILGALFMNWLGKRKVKNIIKEYNSTNVYNQSSKDLYMTFSPNSIGLSLYF